MTTVTVDSEAGGEVTAGVVMAGVDGAGVTLATEEPEPVGVSVTGQVVVVSMMVEVTVVDSGGQ